MKTRIIIGMLVVTGSLCRGGLITETFTPNTPIPAGNPVGQTFVGTVSDFSAGSLVTGLTVELIVSGGYNGSFVISLQAPNGTSVSLLNRPGATGDNPFGYGGSGLNLTLSDAALNAIQSTPETPGAVVTGTYQAAGSLSALYGSAANGNWTLYFADVNAGGGSPTLNSFSLDITAVPEPVNLALGMFGVVMAGMGVWQLRRRK